MSEYKHDEFKVVGTDNRFGGFEVLEHEDKNATVSSQAYCLDLLLLVEGSCRAHASSVNALPQITPLNLITCALFHYYVRSFTFLI